MPTRSARSQQASELSPEVEWYLESRGFGSPTVAPLWRTPEPRNYPGAVFDPARVDRAITALRSLRHTKGKWAGRPIEPHVNQVAFIIAPVFGWVAPDAAGDLVRIIREAYVEMPRKGAKTTLVGALAMILAFADDEPGAEVILGAASKDQAGQAYKPLELLARNSSTLKEAGVVPTKAQITRTVDGSFVKAVSSRGDLAHGANVHGSLVDELHVHKNGDLLEALETGTGARRQPLGWIITTADEGSTTSVYAQRRELIEKLCKRLVKAPRMYGVIFAAPEEDPCEACDGDGLVGDQEEECGVCNGTGGIPVDRFSEETWQRANPLYPITPSPEYMRAAADKARANPVALASFERLHLGIRSRVAKRFLDLGKWDRNRSIVDATKLKGHLAFGGLDLASVSDLTALSWVFPDDEGGYDVLWRFWLPEEALPRLDAVTARSASGWEKEGWIQLTPGDVTDYDFIKRQVKHDLETYKVRGIGYDRWNSSQLVIDLGNEGAPMVKVGQGIVSLSAPMKEMDRLTRVGTPHRPMLRHGGNPVARWMADNLIPYVDPSGNVKPDKAKSMEKIDGISALVTALAVAMTAEPERRSSYGDRGMITI